MLTGRADGFRPRVLKDNLTGDGTGVAPNHHPDSDHRPFTRHPAVLACVMAHRMALCLVGSLLLLAPHAFSGEAGDAPPTATNEGLPADLRRELRASLDGFYLDDGAPPEYARRVDDLAEPAQAPAAAQWLIGLLLLAHEDVASGRSPYKRLPYWGGGREVSAEVLAGKVKEAVMATQAPGAAPVLAWILEGGADPKHQTAAASALSVLPGPAAEAAILAVVRQGHSNGKVLVTLVDACGQRRIVGAVEVLRTLRGHHRLAVRAATVVSLKAMGQEPGPETAPAFPPVARSLGEAFLRMLDRVPGPDAAAVVAIWPAEDKRPPHELPGWRVDPSTIRPDELALSAWGGWPKVEPADADHVWMLGWTGRLQRIALKPEERQAAATVAAVDRQELLRRIAAGRSGTEHSLSSRGGLTGQFESGIVTMPEILVAAQAVRLGDEATASAVLVPVFDAAPDDRFPLLVARDLIAADLHQRLLNAWCEDRLEVAAQLAQRLAQTEFDGYAYQGRAKELLGQIAAAQAKQLKLPAASAWPAEAAAMTREARIGYLLDRLPLLRCHQMGQPGGVSYEEGQGELINPYVELQALKLMVADLPLIAPRLADATFLRTFSFWRDFHPGRELHRVRWVVSALVNDVAKRELVPRDLDRRDEAGVARAIAEVVDFATANAGRSPAELRLAVVTSGKDLRQVMAAGLEGLSEQQPAVAVALADRIAEFDAYDRRTLMARLYANNATLMLARAGAWFDRFEARDAAWPAVAVIVRGGAGHPLHARAVAILSGLARGKTDDVVAAVGPWLPEVLPAADASLRDDLRAVLTAPDLRLGWGGNGIVHAFLAVGDPPTFDLVLAALADPSKAGISSSNATVSRELERRDVWAQALHDCGAPDYDALADEATRAKALESIRAWIAAQAQAVRAGKPTLVTPMQRIGESRMRLDAP